MSRFLVEIGRSDFLRFLNNVVISESSSEFSALIHVLMELRTDSSWRTNTEDFPQYTVDEPDSDGSEENVTGLRSSRLMNGRTLLIAIAVLTQVIVLAVVAMIMGVAVLTMCALLGELLVITAIATALERQALTFADLATFMEVCATVMVTVITIVMATVNNGSKLAEGHITTARFA